MAEAPVRSTNWDDAERLLGVRLVIEHYDTLYGAFNPSLTHKDKVATWQQVADQLNASSKTKRGHDEIKKMFQNIKLRAKKKVSGQKGTGGGPAPRLTQAEELLLAFLTDRPQLKGVVGGVESSGDIQQSREQEKTGKREYELPEDIHELERRRVELEIELIKLRMRHEEERRMEEKELNSLKRTVLERTDRALVEEEAVHPDETGMVLHSTSSMFIPLSSSTNDDTDNESSQNQPNLRDYYQQMKEGRKESLSLQRLKKLEPLTDHENRKLAVFNTFGTLMEKSSKKRPSPTRRFSRPGSSLFSSPSPILKSPRSDKSETGTGKLSLIRCLSGFTKAVYRKERLLKDHFLHLKSIFSVLTAMHNMKLKDIRSKVPLCKELVEKLQKEGAQRDDDRGSRGPYGPKYGKTSKMSTVDIDDHEMSGRMSVLGTVKRLTAVENAGKNYFGRRRSRNAASIHVQDKPAVETWEDLLNSQPPEFKDENSTFGFQAGIVTKFMKWYRRASIAPTHMQGGFPDLDKATLSHLSSVQGSDKTDRESVYGQQAHQSHAGSAHGQPERVRKLPIWQQVAQEKSSVFHNKKSNAPNPDAAILRFKRDMHKLKRSVQKENTAELEKIVRERVASFRLKYGTLGEECSPLFERQITCVQRANENVNRSQLENLNVQPSKWYEELKEKTANMTSSHDQPKITEYIQKLQTYAHMDNKTLPLAKAKLCLLMMSLPAYDICQIYMQRALKFIFEHILLGQGAQFDEWVNHRKIPYVILEDTRPKSGNTVTS